MTSLEAQSQNEIQLSKFVLIKHLCFIVNNVAAISIVAIKTDSMNMIYPTAIS